MARALADELLAGTQQAAHLLGLGVRHEAAPDKTMSQEVRQPGRIVHVGLAARHGLHMGGIRQRQIEIAVLQNMPDRLPIDARRLHDDVRAAFRGKPLRQVEKRLRGRFDRSNLALDRAVHHVAQARHHHVLMHIKSGAMRIQNFHVLPPSQRAAGSGSRRWKSRKRAPRPNPALGAIRGAQESQVQLIHGLKHTKKQPDLAADDASTAYPKTPQVSCTAGRKGRWPTNYEAPRLAEALEISGRTGAARYESLQTLYNLCDRAPFET